MTKQFTGSRKDSRFVLEELEARQLFSGGIEGLIVTETESAIATYLDIDSNVEPGETPTAEASIAGTEQQTHEIAFVDTGIENYQALVDDLLNNADPARNIEVVLLDSDRSGIEQISAALEDRDDLDAIHIISHGSDGSVQLGNSSLDAEALTENYLEISLWANAFSDSGDILIYGCNLAASEIGQDLIIELGAMTLADVAASDDLTGAAALGGDWDLEYRAGEIETAVAMSAESQIEYRYTLDVIAGTAGDDVLAGTGGDDVITGLGGNDLLISGGGNDSLQGDAGDDVFRFTGAQNGDVITVDGGTGTDAIDLTGYNIADAVFADAKVTIDTGGFSFEIDYSNIESIQFADVTATVLTGDTSASSFSGGATYIEGDAAFTLDMSGGGNIDWSYVSATNLLSISDTNLTSGSSSIAITSHEGSVFAIDSIASDGVVGTLTTNVDIGQITFTGDNNRIDNITVSNGAGTINSITYFGDMAIAGTVTIDSNLGTFALGPGLDIDSGTFVITGDLRTVDVPNFVSGTVIAERVIGQFDSIADSPYSDNFASPTKVTLNGTTTTEAAPNSAPTAANVTLTINEDSLYTFTAADFGYNDPDGDALSQVKITSLESAGSLKLSGVDVTLGQVISRADIDAGDLTYEPLPDQSGSGYDSFEFMVSDGISAGSTGSVLHSFVAPAVNSMSGVVHDGTNIWFAGQSANTIYQLDTDGNILSSFAAPGTSPTGIAFDGTNLWIISRDNDMVYEVDTSGNLLSSFATPGTDSRGLTWDGSNLWLVEGTGSLIYELSTTGAVLSSIGWPSDYMRDITWDGTSLWVSDQNDQLIRELNTSGTELSSFAAPSTGAAGLAFDGNEFWHADADTDTIYQIASSNSVTYSAAAYTMTIDVTAVNDVPVATGNTVIASEDLPLVIGPADFNFTDTEGDSLSSVTITGLNLNGGTLTHSAGAVTVTNGMTITAAQLADLTFTSASNDSTDSSFTYTVNDADSGVTSAVMNVTVNAVNDVPVATGNTVIASEDVPLVIDASDFNFTDVEGDSLASVTITGLNLNGGSLTHSAGAVNVTNGMTITAAQLADLTFTSASNDSTDSSFTYTVNDADSGVTSAVMNITVNAVNDVPVATGNTVIASEDIPLVIDASDFNFSDVEGDALASVTITGLNLNGGTLTHTGGTIPVTNGMTITAAQLADLTFTSAANDSTNSSFTYTVNDADSGVTSAIMNITVNAANDAPNLEASEANLWFSSINDVAGSTANGLANWSDGEMLQFGAPDLTFGENSTAGSFSSTGFNLDSFAAGADIDALHYVTQSVTVGTGANAVTLLAGDLVLSTQGNADLTSTNSLSVKHEDIFVFRADTPGDYSSGTFIFLLEKPTGGDASGVSLVEQDTTVGDVTLNAGTFVLSKGDKKIYHYTADTAGLGSTTGTLSTLIEANDLGVDENIVGVALVQNATNMGGVTLTSGQLLVTLDNEDNDVGGFDTERRDVIALDITQSGATTLGSVTGILFDGDDVGLSSNDEDLDALTLVSPLRLNPIFEDISDGANSGTQVADLINHLISDVDGDPEGIAITAVDNTNGSWQYSIDGGSNWLAIGSVTDNSARVLSATANDLIRFVPTAEYGGNATIDFRAWDGSDLNTSGTAGIDASATGGTTAFSSETATGIIEVRAVNDAPVINVAGAPVVTEGVPLTFNTANSNLISITDVDAGNNAIYFSLEVTRGTFTLNGTTGLTFSVGDGTADSSLAFTGTVTDINAALDGMVFTPQSNYAGAAELNMLASDLGNTGSGGTLTDYEIIGFSIAADAINDAPLNSLPGVQSVDEDATLVLSEINGNAISITDDAAGSAIEVTLTASDGTVTLSNLVGSEFQVNTEAAGNQNNAQIVATPGGGSIVVWTSKDQDGSGEGIFAQMFDASGLPQGLEFQVNTTTTDDQMDPSIAVAGDGSFVVVWTSKLQDGDGEGIFAQRFDASGNQLGVEFQVNSYTTEKQELADVAMDASGNFVIVWQSKDQDSDREGIYMQRYDNTGAEVGIEVRVNTTIADAQKAPSVAMDASGDFVVVWQSKGQDADKEAIIGRYFDAAGPGFGAEFQINTYETDAQLTPEVAMNDAGAFVVAWESKGQDGNRSGIYAQMFDATAAAVNSEFLVNSTTADDQKAPSVSINTSGEFVIAWQSKNQDFPDRKEGVYAQHYAADGTAKGGEFRVNTTVEGRQLNTAVTLFDDGSMSAVWDDGKDISCQRFINSNAISYSVGNGVNDSTVTFTATQADINAVLDGLSFTPNANFNGVATLTITTDDLGNTGTGGVLTDVDVLTININAVNDAPTLTLPAAQSTTEEVALVFSSGNSNAITISDDAGASAVEVTLTAINGNMTLNGITGLSFTTGTGTDDTSMVFTGMLSDVNNALEGLSFLSPVDYVGLAQITVQVNDQGNTGIGGALTDSGLVSITVLSDGVNDAPLNTVPATQYNSIDTQVVFNETNGNLISISDDSGNLPVQVTLTATDGTLTLSTQASEEIQVNALGTNVQLNTQVATSADGAYVIVWQSDGNQDGDKNGIFAQLYDPFGNMLGGEITVNTETAGEQITPVVAMSATGSFVIAWESDGNLDGDGKGIFMQMFDPSGNKVDVELQANTTSLDDQTAPAIAMDDSGNFIVTWQSNKQDGDGQGIYAQLFDANGFTLGDEFLVTSTVADDQTAPSVAMNAGGDFVITWQSKNQDADGEGIFAQRYDSLGVAQGVEFRVNVIETKHQTAPSIAMDDLGNFVIAWQSENQDTDGMGIYTRHFDALGNALDAADVLVNSTIADDQTAPSVSMNASGEHVIVWQSKNQDGDGEGVYGQWFAANGSAVGNEFLLSSETADHQTTPDVALTDGGDFIASWISRNQDGDGEGVYSQKFPSVTGLNFTTGDGVDDTSMVFTGRLSQINAVLDGMTFTPTPGFNGTATLQVQVNDLGNTGSGGALSDDDTVLLQFNTAPVLDNSGAMNLTAINEDDVSNNGNLVSEIIDSATGDRITDANTSPLEGIAVTAVDNTNGSWQYSINGGSNWTAFGSVSNSAAVVVGASANDRIRFVPATDFNGSVTPGITFRAWDMTDGNASGTASVDVSLNGGNTAYSLATETADIVVTPVADPPTTDDVSVSDNEDATSISVTITGSDSDGSVDFFRLNNLPANGTLYTDAGLTTVATPALDYAATAEALTLYFVPNANWNGVTTFDYVAKDDTGQVDATAATATITVNAVNDVPVATGNTVIASEDVPLVIDASDFNFSDVEGDALASVTITGLNLNGGTLTHTGGSVNVTNGMTITAAQLADLTFTSASNDSTDSSFTYTVNDADSGVTSAIMNITVNAVNDAPVATGNTVIASEDVPLVIDASDFNFSDAEGDSLSSVTITGLNLNGGTLTHTGGSVNVTNGMTITAAQLADLTFTSASNDSTDSSFTYTVNDADSGVTSAVMNITVNAVNDVPVATGNTVIASEDVPLVIDASDFNFSDEEGDSLASVTITGLNLNGGTLTHSAGAVTVTNGMTITAAQLADLTFTSAANDSTDSSFTYTVNDADSGVTSAVMNITVNAVNDVPVATGNTVIATEDVALVIGASDFNFTDVEGDSLASVTITGLNLNGGTLTHTGGSVAVTNGMTITAAQLADLTFTSAANDSTDSSFTYTVNDADSGVTSAVMNITVNAVNDAPVATGNTVIASEDVPLVIDASDFNFSDAEGDSLASVTITGLNLNGGTLTHTGGSVAVTNGMTITTAQLADLTFTSASNDSTDSSFTYTVNDADAGVTSAIMNITVNAVNDVPVATGNTVIALEDVPLVIDASDFDFTDTEGDSLSSVTITGLNLNGGTLTHTGGSVNVTNGMTITAAQLADLTFTSASNDSTDSSFTYTVNDADSGVTSAVMNITVNAVNDAPVATGNTVIASEDVPLVIGPSDFNFTDEEGDSLASVTITGLNLNGGTLTHSAGAVTVTNGMTITAAQLADLTFTSASNDSTDSSFTYTVNDADSGVTSAIMNITVNAVNDVPVATGNTVIASEDVPLVIDASDFDFTDTEGDSLSSVTITGLNLNGGTLTHSAGAVTVTNGMTITAAQLADLTFTSAANDSTDSSFTYTVNDADSGVTSAVMNITVNAVNDVPVATGNTVIASEDVPLVIDASDFNFSDVEGDALASVTITGLNLNGGTLTHTGGTIPVTNGMTITAAQLADLTFTSASNDSTDSSFTYTVNDADSGVISAIMNITVNAVNDAPVATGNTVIASEDVPLVIDASDFNFSDIEGDALASVTITGLNLNGGTLTHTGGSVNVTNGMTITAAQLADLTFTSASNDSTDSSFTYTVNDADSGVTSAVMNITVNAVNDVPVATGNTVIASEDVPLVIDASDFDFTDTEGDSLSSVTITGLNLNGGTLTHSAGAVTVTNGMTITAAQLADLTFTSAANDSTDSSFTYTVNDADSGVTSAVMNITVNAVNDAPVATGNTVIASEDVPLVIDASDFNFSDAEGDSLASVTITGLNLNGGTLTHTGGSVAVTNGMTITTAQLADLTFTSASNDSTDSSFTYTVNDADAGVTSAIMNITVNAVNDVPVATGNTVIASEDVPLVIDASDFNFTDEEGDALASVTITGLNLNGGTLTHTGGSVNVTNGMTITAAQLADLTFTSASNDSTDSSFTYTVNDADSGVTSAIMNITVNAVNDAPVATGNTVIASEDVPLVIDASDFNFSDAEGDSLSSVTITGLNLNGGTLTHTGGSVNVTNGMTITAAQLADLTFTSASNDSTDSSFTYTVNDADSGVTSAVMNITVNAVNDVPVATGNTVIASEDVPLVIDASDFNFSDEEGDSLASVTITGLNLNGGTLTHSAGAVTVTNGMTITAAQLADLTFTSAANDSTDSSFTYTVNDADSGVTSAVMNITVNAVNDTPVATGNTVIATEDVALVIGASDFNFTDVEGDSLASVTITGLNLNGGTLTHTGGSVAVTNGMTITAAQLADLTFTSAANDSTDSSFTYTVNDADSGVTSAIMNITVNAVNDAPVATGNTVIASEDVPLVIDASDFNFSDAEGDSLSSVTITGLNLNGGTLTHTGGSVNVTNGMTITAAQLADLTFTSAANDSTDSSFTYTVNDADSGVTSAVMNITVNAVNDVPVATGNTVIASEDVPLVIGPSDFNFSDEEGDSLASVTITGLNLNGGTLTHTGGSVAVTNGMIITTAQLADLTFTSASNDSTDSSFTYTVNDADAGVTSAIMNITVNAVNDVPVATGNTVIASEDVPLVIDSSDFNFTDEEGDALASVTITGLNLNGGTLTHTGGSVNVTNGMTITAAQLADLTFTSASNDSTDSSFTYTVNDADSGVTSAVMNITVNAVNDAPVATGNTVIASEDVPLVIDASDFNFSDLEGDSLSSVTITGLNLNGGTLTHTSGSVNVTNGMTITAAQLADLTFTSASNDSTDSSFTYTVNDADSGVTSAIMNITVNAVNDVPVATGNTVIASEDVPLVIGPSDFNFTDEEGDSLASVTITGLNLNGGTLTHSAGAVTVTNGMTITAAQLADLTFTSASNDSTDSNFTYTVNDADAGVTSAIMNITVNAVNDVPVATGNTVIASEDVPLVIDASDFNFSDEEGDSLASVTITGLNLNGGTLTHTGGSVNVTNGMTITAAQLADLTFTSASNDSTDSSFTYTVNDADSGVTSAVMNITVNAVNDAPVATSNNVIASEDVPLVIDASDFNFSDVEGDALASVTITGLNLNGGTLTHSAGAVNVTNGMTITAAQLADLTFTSASNDSTDSSFTYTVNDADSGVTSAIMNITVNAVNDVPVATGNTVIASEDVPLVIDASDFNFTDEEGDSLASVTITGLNLNGGTLTHSAGAVTVTNGMTITAAQLADLTFTSAANDSTDSSFTYTVNDADSGVTSAIMNITVNAVNDVPVATGNTVIASEDVPLVIDASDFNFSDEEGDSLASVTITGLNLNGGTLTHSAGAVTVTNGMTITAAQLADLTFTSAANDSTDSSFTYTVNDADSGVTSAIMNITVNAVNDVPVATGNTVIASEDVPLVIDASDFNFSDEEGDSLASVTITGLNLNGGTLTHTGGTVAVTNGMTITTAQLADLTFTSASNDSTDSSFTYTVNDADSGVTSAVMNITVNAVNDVPVATGNTVIASEDIPLVIDASDFNFSDIEGDALASVTITGLNLNGGTLTHTGGTIPVTNGMTITAAQLADLTFTSASNDSTDSSFTYTVNDADSGVISAVMNITVNAVNDVPVATGNTVIASEDVPLVIGPSDFNFSDEEGDSLASVTITGLNLNGGTLTHSAGAVTVTNGMTITAAQLADLTFTSASNDSTDSSFTYTVNDADSGVTSAVMNITVNAVNDVPVATGNTVIASEDVPLVIGPSDFNFTDEEGDSLASVTITGLNLNGGTLTHTGGSVNVTNGMTITAAQLADLTFTSASNDSTDSSFTYTVNDADSGVTSAVMNITVNAVNDTPVIGGGDTGSVSEDVGVIAGNITTTGSLTITDPDAGESSFQAGTVAGAYGNLTINSAGNWTYTADNGQAAIQALDAGESITDTLSVSSFDGSTHSVVITINGNEDTPVFVSTANTAATENTVYSYTINTSDVDIETLTITAPILPAWLTFVDNGDGTATLSGTPSNAEVGNHNVVLNVSDGTLNSSQVFTITVNNPSPEPVVPAPPVMPPPIEPIVIEDRSDDPAPEAVIIGQVSTLDGDDVIIPEDEASEDSGDSIIALDTGASPIDQSGGETLVTPAGTPEHDSAKFNHTPANAKAQELLRLKALQEQQANQSTLNLYKDTAIEIDALEESALWASIDNINRQLDTEASSKPYQQVEVQILVGSTASLTAGFVSWVLRGGSLLASMMSSVPVLNRFDPLPILKSRSDKGNVTSDDDDDSTDSTLVAQQKKVDRLFDSEGVDK